MVCGLNLRCHIGQTSKRYTSTPSPALLKAFDIIVIAAVKTGIEKTLLFSARDFKLAERVD